MTVSNILHWIITICTVLVVIGMLNGGTFKAIGGRTEDPLQIINETATSTFIGGIEIPDLTVTDYFETTYVKATSTKSSTFGGSIGIGTTSPSSRLSTENTTGTSTAHLGTGAQTDQGSCIQMYSPNGTHYEVYVKNNGTLVAEVGSCDSGK